MSSKLEDIRNKLKQQQGGNNSGGFKRDNSIFPHWNIPNNTSATLRFLPDGNEDNIMFWVEKQTINLPFKGVKGTDHDNEIIVKVPCADMYKPKSCPVTQEIVPWFNTDMDSIARKYWKNRTYLFQGFVVQSDLEEDDVPENPIRRFIMSKSIFKLIQDSLLDADNFDCIPTDYENGVNFKIKKTSKSANDGRTFADYSTSGWERKETALTEEQLEAINTHGLYDLSSFLPDNPDEEQKEVIFEMFKASLDDQPYDPDKWKDYYAPFGLRKIMGDYDDSDSDSNSSSSASTNQGSDDTSSSSNDDNPLPSNSNDEDKSDDSGASKNANDILEQLKNRAKSS